MRKSIFIAFVVAFVFVLAAARRLGEDVVDSFGYDVDYGEVYKDLSRRDSGSPTDTDNDVDEEHGNDYDEVDLTQSMWRRNAAGATGSESQPPAVGPSTPAPVQQPSIAVTAQTAAPTSAILTSLKPEVKRKSEANNVTAENIKKLRGALKKSVVVRKNPGPPFRKQQPKHQLELQDRVSLLRIKAAVENIESQIDNLNIGHRTGTTLTPANPVPVAPSSRVTQPSFPGEYKGFSPISAKITPSPATTTSTPPQTSPAPKTSSASAGNQQVTPTPAAPAAPKRALDVDVAGDDNEIDDVTSDDDHLRRSYASAHAAKRMIPSPLHLSAHHFKPNRLPKLANSRARGHQRSIATDILQELWTVKNMLNALYGRMEQGVRTLANMDTDHSHEQRSEIQSSGDRISQLQKALTDRVDDLRYNITMLMTSQAEMRKSTITTFQSMKAILKELMGMVSKRHSAAMSAYSKLVPTTKSPNLTPPHSPGIRLVLFVGKSTNSPHVHTTSQKTQTLKKTKHKRDQKQKRGYSARELRDLDIDRQSGRQKYRQYSKDEDE